MIRFKPEVRIRRFRRELADVLEEASYWSLVERVDVEINSVDDSAPDRSATTLHGSSLAVDLDTAGDKATDTRALADHLRRTLPPGYDVILESDHVHVEWDMKRPVLRKVVS